MRLNKQLHCLFCWGQFPQEKNIQHLFPRSVQHATKILQRKTVLLPLPLCLITHLMRFHTASCCSGQVWPLAPYNRAKAVAGERVHQSSKLGSTTSSLFTWNSRAQPPAVTSPIQHAEIIRQHRNSRQTVFTQRPRRTLVKAESLPSGAAQPRLPAHCPQTYFSPQLSVPFRYFILFMNIYKGQRFKSLEIVERNMRS